MPCFRAHLLPGSQGTELSSLQEETKGQRQLLPSHRTQPEGCTAPSAWKAPLSPRAGGKHPAGISSQLDSSCQHLLSKSIPTPATSPSTTRLHQGDFPWLVPTHNGVPQHTDYPGNDLDTGVQAKPTATGDMAESYRCYQSPSISKLL